MADKPKSSGSREMAVRLKSARKRTTSQQIWLQRQLNDPYVAKAKEAGYKSRAAFKLLEIDDKYKLLKPGMDSAEESWRCTWLAAVRAPIAP